MSRGALAAALGIALASAGCISVGGSGTPPDRRAYDLLPEPSPTEPAEADGPEVIWVEPFTADKALERDEIVWRRGAVESGAWEHHRWARPPAEAIRALLSDALARSGACAAVATEPRPALADYRLGGHLSRCDESDAEDGWTGVLEVRVALVRTSDGAEVMRRTYSVVEKAPQRNPLGVVRALRAAAEKAGKALAKDVAVLLESHRAPDAAPPPPDGPPKPEPDSSPPGSDSGDR